MPPKKQGKKEEALESLEGLPKAFPFIVQLHYNVDNPETKELLMQHIEEELEDKCKLITRYDIIECGKRKEFITEEEDPETIPPDRLAKSAAAIIYETLAEAMKEKGVKYNEIKSKAIADHKSSQQAKADEAKGKGKAAGAPKSARKDEEIPEGLKIEYPSDEIDLFIFLQDYPRNEAEALGFSEERYALNLVVSIKEGPPMEVPKEDKYDVVNNLGKGSFGEVQLIKDKETKVKRALKSIPKQNFTATDNIMEEMKILKQLV